MNYNWLMTVGNTWIQINHFYIEYTRGVWDLGVNVRPIYFMARRNDE